MDFTVLKVTIGNASEALLQGRSGEANELLSHVYDELIASSSTLPLTKIERLKPVLEVMYSAQQKCDYVYLADILRYELPKLIGFTVDE